MKRRTFIKDVAITGLTCSMPQCSILEDKVLYEKPEQNTGFEKYGRVIFSKYPEAQNQLYIIGQKHENPITNKIDVPEVPLIQTQIYRICEVLRKKGVKLIINEGITLDANYQSVVDNIRNKTGGAIEVPENCDDILEDIFKNPGLFAGQYLAVNNPDMVIRGAEDKSILDKGLEYLTELPDGINRQVFEFYCLLRSGLSLAQCPSIMYEEYKNKKIPNINAMFIIGSRHLNELEEYTKNSRIIIPELKIPGVISTKSITYEFPIEKLNMGVTIILPNAIKEYKK